MASPTSLMGSDMFSNIWVLSAIVPRVDAMIMKRCMSLHAKISNFYANFATIIDSKVSYSR